jgi:hypothetical protein
MEVSNQFYVLAALFREKEPLTQCTGGWMDRRVGLDIAVAKRTILAPSLPGIEPRS